MIAKILKAVQSTQQKYPNGLQQGVDAARKALSWIERQPFGAEVKELYRNVSFNINVGSFPELGVNKFGVVKDAGSLTLFGSTERNGKFAMSLNGALKRAQKTVSTKKGEAKQKSDAAKVAADNARRAADEAHRLSLEAARLAEQAEAEANTFESAVGSFASVR